MKKILASVLIAGLAVTGWYVKSATQAEAANKFVTIGTGGVTGVYYPAGGAICRLVNRGKKEHGIRCNVESTGGSIYNLNAIRNGELDIGVAESGWQYHAYHGSDYFEKLGADKDLRSLFSLHAEPFTVVARADAGIDELDDLVGKRVNIGNPGSGVRANMDVVMDKKGWDKSSFKLAAELKPSELGQALCDNKIDAFVYVAGHPNGAIQEVTSTCETKIIPVVGDDIDEMLAENPFYAPATIPGGMYPGTEEAVKTFGAKATLVSSSRVEEDVIYEVVSAVFDNFDNFKTLHPVFATLEPSKMVYEGLNAPLHAGAVRYYREHDLLPEDESKLPEAEMAPAAGESEEKPTETRDAE